jgi:hypothetical protein
MLNNSIRIRTTPDGKDKYLKVKLDQEFDFIEILSLKITQAEAYRNFCADYGVVVGRVFINNGFGIPNARVSIFIPIDDVDKDDPVINGLYPYEVVTDKDIDGKRYNLLPKTSETDNECYTPVGTFPNKREVLDDPEIGHVYCKYYKFTTSTNYAGDYMIFGVPVGNYTVHVDADISDIGIASQRPYDSISQGSPIQMFDSPTKFKGGTNLDRLIQVKTTNAGVNVQPFWGSVENCEIGISRIDLDLNYEIKPSAIFMGGVFGDSDNNSVNKNCRPRRKMGKICEQNTSEGTIEMIRETLDGNIEKLDIEGGKLIDDKGAWAYQIPMNLDYYYTNEFGELVLSEDPNKGIPTRASVRFKIAMDGTGGEGRLRTRANYLVPHNPNNVSEIDYEFGELTKDFSFRDLYWNKIYSVSNFISRYQRAKAISTVKNRNFVGLKDVDDCVGDKLPTPFNRVNTVFNPLFFIICLIMRIIEFILFIINSVVITVINFLLFPWNKLMGFLCRASRILRRFGRPLRFLRFFCRLIIPYIKCIYAKCPYEESNVYYFAPGCINSNGALGLGYQELKKEVPPALIKNTIPELSNCVAASMARALNLFQFDFYNDWLNGSLYYYLVKYKKRRRREKYCNYDCSSGRCRTSLLLDTCYKDQEDSQSAGINEGLIKKYNGELYYAPIMKNGVFKLYATEIVNLGSVFKCDWQGVPKIQEFLVPTTYISPPLIDEYSDENPALLETTGQIDIGSSFEGVFFKISCAGLSCNRRQTLNIRHSCEFGVDLDEIEEEDNGTIREPNANFGAFEINSEYGKYVRDTFFGLNNVTNNINVNFPYSTDFNLCNVGEYNFASDSTVNPYVSNPTCTLQQNGTDYVDFRGYLNNSSFSQPKHSFYFYFGVVPGAGGLEKMNANFFTRCFPELTVEFFIRIDDTTAITQNNLEDGTATFTIISGVGPFSYVVSGPNGYNTSGTLTQPNTTVTLNGLGEGVYTINVTDSSGVIISQTFEVSGPIPLYASAAVTATNSSLTAPYNGQITLISVGGGNGTYNATLYNSNGVIASTVTCNSGVSSANGNPTSVTQLPITFCGLSPDIAPNFDNEPAPAPQHNGYYIVVTDTSNPQQTFTIRDLTLAGVSGLNVQVLTTNTTCYDSTNGVIKILVTGGVEPYTIQTYSQNDPTVPLFNGSTLEAVSIGTYFTTVTDSSSPQQVVTTPTYQLFAGKPEMKLLPDLNLLPLQCDPTKYTIYLRVINGGTGLTPPQQNYTQRYGTTNCYIQYNFDDAEDANDDLLWSQPPTAVTYLDGQFNIKVEIPSTTQFGTVKIRLSDPQGTCGSDYGEDNTEFDILEMRLPPAPLIIDVNNIDNDKQCLPNKVSFKMNISHLSLFATYRAPYTLKYQIANQSGIYGPVITHTTLITQNQQLITLNVPTLLGGASPTSATIKFTLTDNVGCVSNLLTLGPIQIPTQALGLSNGNNWTITYVGPGAVGAPNSIYNKAYQIVGGIAPYTTPAGQPLLASPTSTSASANVALNNGLTITIEDSVGCLITRNSG